MPKGQALNEYLLIVAVIVLASVVTVGLLGQQLSGMFANMIQSDSAASTARVEVMDLGLPAGPGTQTVMFPMRVGDETVMFSIPNYPSDLAHAVETAGASGTSELLATFLNQMATQLENMDPPQTEDAALLRELSEHGFGLASRHQDLESKLTRAESFIPLDVLLFLNWSSQIPQEKIDKLQNPSIRALVEDAFGKLRFSSEKTALYVTNEIERQNRIARGQGAPTEPAKLSRLIARESFEDNVLQSSNVCNASSANQVEGLSCVPN
jgi:Flp pilus assembly pilin Flp